MDPYGGADHLLNSELVFLHSESMKDDPTRVVRAARYTSRFDFTLREDAVSGIDNGP